MAAQTGTTKLRVESLHALAYCERLFYLEEVENVRLADASVYAGRTSELVVVREISNDAERR